MPTREQMATPDEPPPAEWWESVLSDPRAAGNPWLPIQQRLSEIPRHLLRVECLRCQRIVEIQRANAIRLYGPHAVYAVYQDVGQALLDGGCEHRTGSHEEDGCWPNWTGVTSRTSLPAWRTVRSIGIRHGDGDVVTAGQSPKKWRNADKSVSILLPTTKKRASKAC
jgi:hypothetical protein